MERKTHNGNIKSDTLMPDYIGFNCAAYNLPDNTQGMSGYHVIYRPLARGNYIGHDVITNKMIEDVQEHYRIINKNKELSLREPKQANKKNQPCPRCGTWCYGDCEAANYR